MVLYSLNIVVTHLSLFVHFAYLLYFISITAHFKTLDGSIASHDFFFFTCSVSLPTNITKKISKKSGIPFQATEI